MVSGFKAASFFFVFSLFAPLIPAATPAFSQTPPPTIHSTAEALRAHDYTKALELARVLVRQEPGDSRAWVLEGIALSNLGQSQEALKAFRQALAISPESVPALEGAAQIEYNTGQWQEAGTHLDKLVRLNPQEETAHAMLGVISFRRKDCASALTHFSQSWRVIENSLTALAEYGTCLLPAHDPEQAIPVFKRMSELEPGDWRPRYNMALVYHQAHQNNMAIETLLPVTEGSTANADCLNLIAAVYEADQQTSPAVKALQKAISLAPKDPDNYLDLAVLCLDHGSFQVGVDLLNAGLQVIPDSAPLYIQRGVLYIEMKRFAEADADFEKANSLNPHQDLGTVALGLSLLQANNLDGSLKVIRTRLGKTPNSPTLNYLLAEALLRKGVQPGTPGFNEAVAAARRSTHADPNFLLAHDVLSELYLRSDRANEAIAESRAALKIDPEDQPAVYHLIVGMRKTGNQAGIPGLTQQLAQASTATQRRESERNRIRLVEEGVTPGRETPLTFTQR